ncbi:uncharacterized protein [Phaseolus vulgaris]|uniref:uncharacterized protein n=1 Tax=Phaseolus vulgaris TaxID=3885 RepID=UPI0035CB183E
MADKLPFEEGASINRPPLFCGVNYKFWKVGMKIFVESIDKGIWSAIKNGHFIPMVEDENFIYEKPWSQWTEQESKKVQYDCIAKNIITSDLSFDEFFRVSQCESAKEMWDTLEVTQEGTNDVKRARKHTLIQEYEMFKMQKGETIVEVQKRFTRIVNHLLSLGKTFDKEELNIKVFKCLDRSRHPKVTAISKSKDLTSMTVASLFGKLREHELEMDKLNLQENEDKRVKTIALKAVGNKSCQDSSDESDEETFSLLPKKFSKFLKKINNKNHLSNKYDIKKPINFNFNKYTCFGCGEHGHIKTECPNKERKDFKKHEKKEKSIRVYNDNSSSSSSSEEEEANLCLMTRQESDASSVSSNSSIDSETIVNFSMLLRKHMKKLTNWLFQTID